MEGFTLETAENVPVRYEISTIGSRSAAFLIDFAIIVAIILGVEIMAVLPALAGQEILSSYVIALSYLVVGTLQWAYFVVNEMIFNGSSVGKKQLGLTVIKEDGSPIDLVDSLTRNFIRYVDLFPGTYLVGVVIMLLNGKSRRLGDFAAGTVVVRVSSLQLDKIEIRETIYDEAVRTSAFLSSITPKEYQLMRDYLTQRHRLPVHTSAAIAQKLANHVAEKLSIEPPRGSDKCLQLIESCVKYYR